MDIETALKTAADIRLTFGRERWLIWDDLTGWSVYERKRYARETTFIYAGHNLEEALDILVKEG